MKKQQLFLAVVLLAFATSCATSYKAKPLPFKTPTAYENHVEVAGVVIGAEDFSDSAKANEAFGFDVRGAGMLPVQVVFDNQGSHSLEIKGDQTFLIDDKGNLWPVLSGKIAYERATKYSKTKEIFKEGAYAGFLGATAGSIIGAAIGIVTGEDVLSTVGKGAAVGAAAGATIGGAGGYGSNDARQAIITDLKDKSLQNKAVAPKSLAHGFLFFPGEAGVAGQLRLQLFELETGKVHVLTLGF
jgi:hypothetical protein